MKKRRHRKNYSSPGIKNFSNHEIRYLHKSSVTTLLMMAFITGLSIGLFIGKML